MQDFNKDVEYAVDGTALNYCKMVMERLYLVDDKRLSGDEARTLANGMYAMLDGRVCFLQDKPEK